MAKQKSFIGHTITENDFPAVLMTFCYEVT